MTWSTEIQTKYDEELTITVSALISTTHPGYQTRPVDEIRAKNAELNQALTNPTGNKTVWMATVETLRTELSTLIEQDNRVVADNHESDINYRTAVDAEIDALKQVSDNKWNAARTVRNWLLSLCDWTQLSDAPLSEEQNTAWQTYRQALRDLPETFETVESIEWPIIPE